MGSPMEILLIEDSLMDARLTIGSLARSEVRHRLTLIRDGEEALEFLKQEGKFVRAPKPDLVLLDLLLPKVDGVEVLSAIRETFHLKLIPVVVLTSCEAEEDRLRCEMLDVESYIIKPVNMSKFLDVVRILKHHLRHDLVLPANGDS